MMLKNRRGISRKHIEREREAEWGIYKETGSQGNIFIRYYSLYLAIIVHKLQEAGIDIERKIERESEI